MALFSSARKYSQSFPRRRVVVVAEPAPAEFMKRLDILHSPSERHPLPVRMRYIGCRLTHRSDQVMYVYACPFPGCKWREGWVQDRRTGKPFRLWCGYHRNQ